MNCPTKRLQKCRSPASPNLALSPSKYLGLKEEPCLIAIIFTARKIAVLKKRAVAAGVPVIYVND
ncbi:MAG TPA: hypothetical protein VE176_15040, partial [Candidatus Limnocylindrales bacterium]|nr:hypothetical protein [Candidatus Limnocylindrales bacterium]